VSEDPPLTREQLLAARYFYRNLAEARLKRIEELEAEVARLHWLLEEAERAASAPASA
jgi:hypothetical protein